MQTKVVEKTDNSVLIEFEDANLTFITPLIKELNNDENVVLVRYIDEHPELKTRKLYVECKKGEPLAAIKKASKAMADYFSA